MNQQLNKLAKDLCDDFALAPSAAIDVAIAVDKLETFFGKTTLIWTQCGAADLTAAAEWLRAHGYSDRETARLPS